MEVERLAAGLWRWTGWHEEWRQTVGSVYYETGKEVVLFDPILPPEDSVRFLAALDRDVARIDGDVHIMLTVYWHARSAGVLAERYRARVWAPARARTAAERRLGTLSDPFRPGDRLPAGIEAFASGRASEVLYWIPEHAALVVGDVLLGGERGDLRFCPESWLGGSTGQAALRGALAALLELAPGRLLVSHGEPVLENAERTLAKLVGA